METRSAAPRLAHTEAEKLAQARRLGWLLDDAQYSQQNGVPAGLAIAVKDNIDVAGFLTRNGTPGARWRTPVVSAPAWDVLARAGGWCVGKTAMHEMAWGVTTAALPGPIDAERMTGGSSGGSAAVVAAGAVRAALGTDTGGSIRIPSALCGVVGLRPTHGAIETAGITALAAQQDVVGPIAADVETAAMLFEILAARAVVPAAGGIRDQRIGVLARTGRLTTDVAAAYEATLVLLAEAGAELIEIDTALPRVTASVSLLRMLISADTLYGDEVRRDPRGHGPEARALLTLGAEFATATDVVDRAAAAVKVQTSELFARHRLDVMLTPTCPCVAPKRPATTIGIGGRNEHVDAALTRFTAWAAVAGIPALSVPASTPRRLPAGVQIMAPPDREDACVRTALTIEEFTAQPKGDQ